MPTNPMDTVDQRSLPAADAGLETQITLVKVSAGSQSEKEKALCSFLAPSVNRY